jgi:tetratricopeptide (TPR) repeat protein
MTVDPLPTSSPCPSEEDLVRLLERRLQETDARAITSHLDGCEACRLAVGLLAEAPESTPAAPAEVAPAVAPGSGFGPYRVERWVGGGAMGDVYAAFDDRLQRRVAVKRVRQRAQGADAEARLLREAQALARLRHANVVAVYDVGLTEGRAWLAMEFVDGPTLRQALRHPPPRPHVEAWLLQCARALQAAHAAGIVHRDFKPENVLVASDGTVRVTDFGLAEMGEPTPDMVVAGTPAYMAPEQARGAAADPRADQYAFCLCAVEALTGVRPSASAPLVWTGARLTERQRVALRRGLSAQPEDRFPSMEALLEALAPRSRRWSGWLVALLLTLGAAGGVTGWRATRCSSAESRVAEVWNAQRREAFGAAARQIGTPLALETAERLPALFDTWAAQWSTAFVGSCEATRLRGEQSEELLDRQGRCLEQQRQLMLTVARMLETPDKTTLENVDAAFFSVGAPQDCLLRTGGTPGESLPAEAALARRVEAVRQALARARLQAASGHLVEALRAVEAQRAEVAAIQFQPLTAQHGVELGLLQEEAGQGDVAAATLAPALNDAVALGDDNLAFAATINLARATGHAAGDFTSAARYLDSAKAWLVRLGHPAALEREWNEVAGGLALHQGDSDTARAHFAQALSLARVQQPPSPQALVTALLNLALAEYGALRCSAAEPLAREAVSLAPLVGRQSALMADAHHILGLVLYEVGQGAESLEAHRRALDIVRSETPDDVSVGDMELSYGEALVFAGRESEAEAHLLTARRIFEAAGMDEQRANALTSLGRMKRQQGLLDEARESLNQSLALREQLLGRDHRDVAATLDELGRLELDARHPEAACASFQRALAIDEATGGAEVQAADRAMLGVALAARGRSAEGEATLRRALEDLTQANPQSQRLGGMHLALARLLLDRHAAKEADLHLEAATARLQDAPWQKRLLLAWTRVRALDARGRADDARTPAEQVLTVLDAHPDFAGPLRDEAEAWARAHNLSHVRVSPDAGR